MEAQNVLGGEWDYLLVLDACRYDTFERVYHEYLNGTLEKRRSIGSSTPEWAAKTFTGSHDLAYFSANPFINSLGTPLSELPWGASCDYEWTAEEAIATVVDLWQDAWDDDLGTVPPEAVNAAVRDRPDLVAAHDRTVVHYIQPHAPYLVNGKGYKMSGIRNGMQTDGDTGLMASLGERFGSYLEPVLEDSSLAMKLGVWLELGPGDALNLGRDGTRETVERYYEDNLRRVLEAVVDLLPELDGDVVITADHGEAFGEEGVWEHHIETHIPPLVEVPWLTVDERV
jgi:hypothetical protein